MDEKTVFNDADKCEEMLHQLSVQRGLEVGVAYDDARCQILAEFPALAALSGRLRRQARTPLTPGGGCVVFLQRRIRREYLDDSAQDRKGAHASRGPHRVR